MEMGIDSWYLKSWKNRLSEILNNLLVIINTEDDE
jgi:hypothetical protein